MHKVVLHVDDDGQVIIPKTIGSHVGAVPGSTVMLVIDDFTRSLHIESNVASDEPIPEAERAGIKARVKLLTEEIRAELPQPWRTRDHGDLLFDEDGLPS